MLVHKLWISTRKWPHGSVKDKWLREGWFLFGFIPLYIRDRQNRKQL